MTITRDLARSGADIRWETASPAARAVARHCVLDWFSVTLAGSREPLSEILAGEIAALEPGDASLIGRRERTTLLNAALINGAASHALDFDDTHLLMSGHPSVPVVPAALALAERNDATGAAFLAAVIAGVEVECRLGAIMNPGHYAAGFHATGTLGAFGAASAAAHLLELDEDRWCHALALAGTQAAGLKSGFGTMAKPLHAGRAAANGLLAALLARGGFTGAADIVEADQGFAMTHAVRNLDASRLDPLRGRFLITDTLFKYHASCYLTHAAVEAATRLRAGANLRADDVASVTIHGSAGCVGVCDIAEPETGLQGKFSLRATTAMALLGDDTSDPAAFSDQRMRDPAFVSMRDRTTFTPITELPPTRATVTVRTAAGATLTEEADTGRPARDLDRQWELLTGKFTALATPVLGNAAASRLYDALADLEHAPTMREIAALARAAPPVPA